MRSIGWAVLAALATTLAACETDSYDKGEGKYSLTQADFVTAFTTADKTVASVLADDGTRLSLSTPMSPQWASVADTAYRAVLYYNKVGDGVAQPVSLSPIPTLVPIPHGLFKEAKTDPVTVESVWRSKNGRYVNMGLYIKTGHASEDSLTQTVALMAEDTIANANQTRTLSLRFYHDQGGVPEYYSQKHYLSIPTDSIDADTIRLFINTYDGDAVKALPVR